MFRFILAVPAVLLSFVWSLFFPEQPQAVPAPAPPAPDPDAPSAQSREEGHEVSDASAKTIGIFVLGLFAVIFFAMAALGLMYQRMYANTNAIPVQPGEEKFQYAPREKTTIAKDWDTIDRLAHQRLDGYGWTDQARGIARIPITRAMALVAHDGLPARAAQTPAFPPAADEKLPLPELESMTNANAFDPH